jgi:hypothetical protein
METTLLDFSQAMGIYGFMNTPWAWPVIESLHFIGLSLLLGSVALFDLRIMGYARGISMAALHKLVPFGVLGYGLNVITGTMFLSTVPNQYVYNPAFQIKILFMIIAGINMLVFYRFCFKGVKAVEATGIASNSAKLLALISLVCWIGVIVCGRLITFYRPPFYWCFWCGA